MQLKRGLAVFLSLLVVGAIAPTTLPAQVVAPPPFGGVGYYPGYYHVNANTGNLYGSAQMVDSQGKLMLTTQDAKMQQEKVKQEKLVTRQKTLQQWEWERDNLPNTEDERRRMQTEELRRARNEPPVTEINSGYALNVLLRDLQRRGVGSLYSSPILLDPELLRRINLTPAGRETSIGLFRDGGSLQWPFALQGPEYKAIRESVDSLSKRAVEQAKKGMVDFNTLTNLHKSVDQLESTLRDRVSDTPSNRWVEAKGYIRQLRSSVASLEDPNIAKGFTAWRAQGSTVPELVNFITSQGLAFAPATQGDQTAYQALYRLLADYDVAQAQRTMTASTTPANDKKSSSGFLGIFGK